MGAGGSSHFGAGGGSFANGSNNAIGLLPSGYGGGGGAPSNSNGALAGLAGTAGSSGIVIVWEYA